MRAKRAKTWKAMECFPGIIPSFLIAKALEDRTDVVESAIQLWQSRSTAGPKVDEEKQHYDLFVQAAWDISQHRWSKAEERVLAGIISI